ncbi:MAG: HD domain-containing protein [Infirmifilum uzonense]|uniref:HD domain-containing protein n=1 Tax=Infirmifilum uzonense TaxID=1550241 RepID=UPI003C7925E4
MFDDALSDERFKKVIEKAIGYYRHSHHDISHVERVYNLALRIAREIGEPVDLDVVRAAVILHDIARSMEDEGVIDDHAAKGAELAREILREAGFEEEKIEKVAYSIASHRFRNGVKPDLIEAQILQDADRLDMIGAIGIARAFARGGWSNTPFYDPAKPPKNNYDGRSETVINHFYEKLLKIKDTLNTEPAKKIAEERHRFMLLFLERFMKEWRGEL